MLCVSGNPLCVEFTQEKLHFCFDLIKAKYWAIVRHLAGYAWHCNYLLRCFCLKGCIHAWNQFQRWLVKGCTFFFCFLKKEKKEKRLFAYCSCKLSITCHTDWDGPLVTFRERRRAVKNKYVRHPFVCGRERKCSLPHVNLSNLHVFWSKCIWNTKDVLIQVEQ